MLLFIIMKINNKIKRIIIIIVVFVIFSLFFKGYIPFYPSIPVYPNNKEEVQLVKKYIKGRSKEDVEFFYKTNPGVHYAFLPYVDESEEELNKIITDPLVKLVVYGNKYLLNRARPEQVDSSIKPIDTSTAETPAFPAGHAYQAHVLYKILSKKYPEKKDLFEKLSYECDMCRIKAGLHYPSDGEYSRQLVNLFYN